MKTLLLSLSGIAVCTMVAAPAQADILSFSGQAQEISAPTSVFNSSEKGGYASDLITGFNEKQNFLLTESIKIDGDKTIEKGTKISSHMIFLNQTDEQKKGLARKSIWNFDGIVLGVMSDVDGKLMAATDKLLGSDSTLYPSSFKNRGLEKNNSYQGVGTNTLSLNLSVTQPGDWVRVITAAKSTSVPEPTTMAGFLVVGSIAMFRKGFRRLLK
jgi:hypothetical protein